jgi:hypothetical protein
MFLLCFFCVYFYYIFPNVFLRMFFLCLWIGWLVPAMFPLCCYCVSSRWVPSFYGSFVLSCFCNVCYLCSYEVCSACVCMLLLGSYTFRLCSYNARTMFLLCSSLHSTMFAMSVRTKYVSDSLLAILNVFKSKACQAPLFLLYYISSCRTYVLPTTLGS